MKNILREDAEMGNHSRHRDPDLAGIYQMAPLRFHGPGPDDYEFYFASHIPDLTWCAATDEMVQVGQQIS